MLLTSLVILALAPSAAAHPRDTWYWSPERAASKLTTSSRGPVAFNASYLSQVDCQPIGISIWSSNKPRIKLYKHFDCGFTVNYTNGSYKTVERILHVITAQDFVLTTT